MQVILISVLIIIILILIVHSSSCLLFPLELPCTSFHSIACWLLLYFFYLICWHLGCSCCSVLYDINSKGFENAIHNGLGRLNTLFKERIPSQT